MKPIILVIGGGLAGLTTSLTISANNGRVILLEKQSILGGNSAKASSGINGVLTKYQKEKNIDDNTTKFYHDTLRSAQRQYLGKYSNDLIKILSEDSKKAILWLEKKSDRKLKTLIIFKART